MNNNSLINMSEYQKIIFVNNIDESIISESTTMDELSSTYPFVVFFTKDSREPNKINNIWFDGARCTRFVGVDLSHSKISIGDHSFNLRFNYDNGKLGIYDNNPLLSIAVVQIMYTKLDGSTYYWMSSSDSPLEVVDAIDNVFSMTINFAGSVDDHEQYGANIRNVSKNIAIYNTLTNLITDDLHVLSYEPSSSINGEVQSCEYTVKILKDTYNKYNPGSTNNITYKIVSTYDSQQSDSIRLYMHLNPINYLVNFKNLETNMFGSFAEYGITSGITEGVNEITLNFEPNNLTTISPKTRFFVVISTDNSDVIQISDSYKSTLDETYRAEILNGKATFNINVLTNNITFNSNIHPHINFEVYRYLNLSNDINDIKNVNLNDATHYNLNKSYELSFNGEQTDLLIYYGYENPSIITIDKLIDIRTINPNPIPGETVLYDWEDPNLCLIDKNPSDSETFYIAVPMRYQDKIMPRLDLYTYNDRDTQIYVSNESSFIPTTNVNVANCGIPFIVYTFRYNGFYYGKIQ